MAIRVPSRTHGRDRLLVVGVLTIALGLGTAGMSLVGPKSLPEEAVAASSPSARTVLPGTAASPLTVGDRLSGDPACHPEPPRASRPGPAHPVASDDDPREYLGKMAAMWRRRPVATATTPDPYQASLNPAVYLAGLATPATHNGSPTSVPLDQPCRFQ